MTPSSYMRKRSYQPSSRTFSVLPVSVFERRLLPNPTMRMLNANQQKPSCQLKFILRNTIGKTIIPNILCLLFFFFYFYQMSHSIQNASSSALFSLMGEAVSKSWFQDCKGSSRTLEYHSCRLVSGHGSGLGLGEQRGWIINYIQQWTGCGSEAWTGTPQRGTCRWIGASVAQQL